MKNKYGFAGVDSAYQTQRAPLSTGVRYQIGNVDKFLPVMRASGAEQIQQEQGLFLLREQMVLRLDCFLKLTQANKKALLDVPRHLFVDRRLWSRAYEEMVLPIGFGQTISRPSVVAKILQSAFPEKSKTNLNVLEIGAGCGYLTALMAYQKHRITAIERIEALYDGAIRNLKKINLTSQPRFMWADGGFGDFKQAPFDVIVMSAACDRVPLRLVEQMADGGRLVFPMNPLSDQKHQDLTMIEKISIKKFRTTLLDKVQFVPLLAGVLSGSALNSFE